jgi:hypothetical protein
MKMEHFRHHFPASTIVARIRPLMGQDEIEMLSEGKAKDMTNDLITKQMKRFVVRL